MKRSLALLFLLGPAVLNLSGQKTAPAATPSSQPTAFDTVIDRAVAKENALVTKLHEEHPISETYVQVMGDDPDLGMAPKTDSYFLGSVDFRGGFAVHSFLPAPGMTARGLRTLKNLVTSHFDPLAFAEMMLLDGGAFSRDAYRFEYVRREFLGDVRTWVVDVHPTKQSHFLGRIWIEDRDYNVVRFNGAYVGHGSRQLSMHFDSWRVNCGPNLWLPYQVYFEESDRAYLRYKGVAGFWGYSTARERNPGELTQIRVDAVDDKSEQTDNSPVEALRAWERLGEDNVLNRLEKAHILAREGEVDKILGAVVTNITVTNNLNIDPTVRVRVMLTMPLETFTVGRTIVVSRGLLNTLPTESALAAVLAHELAHIALGQVIDTRYAFSDRALIDDEQTLRKFRFPRPQDQEDQANDEALRLLMNSPYKNSLPQAGLFLRALGHEADRLPSLIRPLFGGSPMAHRNNVLRMSALIQNAPQLEATKIDQVSALPLGSRTRLDPWTGELTMMKTRAIPLLSAREKMPFELTPIDLHLTYVPKAEPEGKNPANSSATRNH